MIEQWKRVFLSIFLFSSLFIAGHAYAVIPANEWVIDPDVVLSSDLNDDLTRLLSQAAFKRDIYVRVFIVNTLPIGSFDEQTEEIIRVWKANNSLIANHPKTGYLVINVKIDQALFVLGSQVVRDLSLIEGLANLVEFVLTPIISKKNYDRAAWEGAIGLTTALEDWSVPVSKSFLNRFYALYHSSILFHCFVWGLVFSGFGLGIAWYLRTPELKKIA